MPTYPRVRPGAVETCFGPTMTARGQEYWQDDRIRTVHWDESTQKLTGSVFGNGGNLYRTTVVLLRSGPEEWEPDRSSFPPSRYPASASTRAPVSGEISSSCR